MQRVHASTSLHLQHASNYNTHPTTTRIYLQHASNYHTHPPTTRIHLQHASTYNTHPELHASIPLCRDSAPPELHASTSPHRHTYYAPRPRRLNHYACSSLAPCFHVATPASRL